MLNQEKPRMVTEGLIDVLTVEPIKTGVRRKLKCKGFFRT
jgi:hypothetical protein